MKALWRIQDKYVLDHSSLDAFLFLRFLKVLIVISFVGCLLTWPILLPLHATGGGGSTELDRVAFGNIVSARKYYVHALLACIYFGESVQCLTTEANSGRVYSVYGGARVHILRQHKASLSYGSFLRR